jgi:hypothetical protein
VSFHFLLSNAAAAVAIVGDGVGEQTIRLQSRTAGRTVNEHTGASKTKVGKKEARWATGQVAAAGFSMAAANS